MRGFSRFVCVSIGVISLVASSAGMSGCSSAPSAKLATVTPGDMPESADWTGVYFDRFYGNFHLVQEGKAVNGKWERPQKDRWGELHGEVTGNVLRFTWSEYTRGAIGANAERSGKGYFVYTRPAGENVDDQMNGELGRGQDEVGEKVTTVKQRNVNADPASIGGTAPSDFSGGDWDKDGSEEPPGEPEAPKKK
jgi:hypothetical protein